jgi:HEAT repeat protein
VLRDERRRAEDRAGAAHALGDLAAATALVERLGDPDGAVRIALCEALGAAGMRTRTVLAALLGTFPD